MEDMKHEKIASETLDWRKRHKALFRTISLILTVAFIMYDITWAQGGTSLLERIKVNPAADHPQNKINDISLPEGKLEIEELCQSGSREVIINIQDAHASLSCQESIVEVLDHLVTNYDLNFIAVEGSEGYIDTSILRTFPDDKIKRDIAESLMGEGRMSAGEFLAVVTAKPIALYGIEDDNLYKENVEAFKEIAEDRAQCITVLEGLEQKLCRLEDKIYKKDLRELNRRAFLHKDGKTSFSEHWAYLKQLAQNNNIILTHYGNIAKLLEANNLESEIDFEKANAERKVLIGELSNKISKTKLEELVLRSISFKKGEISKTTFHNYVAELAKNEHLDLQPYSNIVKFTRYITVYESIGLAELCYETQAVEKAIRDNLFTTKEEEELYELQKMTQILKGLFNINLSNDDLRYFLLNKDKFNARSFADFINEKSRKYKLEKEKDLSLDSLMDKMDEAVDFYKIVHRRNNAMLKNTLLRMRGERQEVACLITGGFHSHGLARILKAKGLSYIVVAPKFEAGKERPYIAILTSKKEPYEELIKGGQYELAIHQYFSTGVLEDFVDSIARVLRNVEDEKLESIKELWRYNYRAAYETLSQVRQKALKYRRISPDEFDALLRHFTVRNIAKLKKLSPSQLNGDFVLRAIEYEHPVDEEYVKVMQDTERLSRVDAVIADFDGVDRDHSSSSVYQETISARRELSDWGVHNITITGELYDRFANQFTGPFGVGGVSSRTDYAVLSCAGAKGCLVDDKGVQRDIPDFKPAMFTDATMRALTEIARSVLKESCQKAHLESSIADKIEITVSPEGISIRVGDAPEAIALRERIAAIVRRKIRELPANYQLPATIETTFSANAVDIMATSKGASAIQMIKLLGLKSVVLIGDAIGTEENPGNDRSLLSITQENLREAGIDWDVDLIKFYVGREENPELPENVILAPQGEKETDPALIVYQGISGVKVSADMYKREPYIPEEPKTHEELDVLGRFEEIVSGMFDQKETPIAVCDLDATVTPSNSKISPKSLKVILGILKAGVPFVALSGISKRRIDKQFLLPLLKGVAKEDRNILKNLIIASDNGTQIYRYDAAKNDFLCIYAADIEKNLGKAKFDQIVPVLEECIDDLHIREMLMSTMGWWWRWRLKSDKRWDELKKQIIDVRKVQANGTPSVTQITFMVTGKYATHRQKRKFHKRGGEEIRRRYDKEIEKRLRQRGIVLEAKVSGLSSVDITLTGIDKGFGIDMVSSLADLPQKNMIFFGDAFAVEDNDEPALKSVRKAVNVGEYVDITRSSYYREGIEFLQLNDTGDKGFRLFAERLLRQAARRAPPSFDDMRLSSSDNRRATISSLDRLNIIAHETHSFVISNDNLNYVIKTRDHERDINNSFEHYKKYESHRPKGIAEYFTVKDMNIRFENNTTRFIDTAVVQERVELLSDSIEKAVKEGDTEKAKRLLDIFADVHKKLFRQGIIDKLFTTRPDFRKRKYLANIGQSLRTGEWVHIDCPDLTDQIPDTDTIRTALSNVVDWFPYQNNPELYKYFMDTVVPRLERLLIPVRPRHPPYGKIIANIALSLLGTAGLLLKHMASSTDLPAQRETIVQGNVFGFIGNTPSIIVTSLLILGLLAILAYEMFKQSRALKIEKDQRILKRFPEVIKRARENAGETKTITLADGQTKTIKPVGVACDLIDSKGNVIAQSKQRVPSDFAQFTPKKYDHAEIVAFEDAQDKGLTDWSDYTLITSLEPCDICAQAIINRGVKKVVIATLDPGPKMRTGDGVRALLWAGIQVTIAPVRLQESAVAHISDDVEIMKRTLLANKAPVSKRKRSYNIEELKRRIETRLDDQTVETHNDRFDLYEFQKDVQELIAVVLRDEAGAHPQDCVINANSLAVGLSEEGMFADRVPVNHILWARQAAYMGDGKPFRVIIAGTEENCLNVIKSIETHSLPLDNVYILKTNNGVEFINAAEFTLARRNHAIKASISMRRLKALTGFYPVFRPVKDARYSRYYHVMRVAKTAEYIAGKIPKRINAEKVETIALCHDFGHAPFAQMGERALRNAGFDYKEKDALLASLKVSGLVLDRDIVRDLENLADKNPGMLSDEAKVVLLADRLIGRLEDIMFALEMRIINIGDIPSEITEAFNIKDPRVMQRAAGNTMDETIFGLIAGFMDEGKADLENITVKDGIFTEEDRYRADFVRPYIWDKVDHRINAQAGTDMNLIMQLLLESLKEQYARYGKGMDPDTFIIDRLMRLRDADVLSRVIDIQKAREDKPSHTFRIMSWWSILGLGGGIDWVFLHPFGVIGIAGYYIGTHLLNNSTMGTIWAITFISIGLVCAVGGVIRVFNVWKAIRLAHPEYTVWQVLTADIGSDKDALVMLNIFAPHTYGYILNHEYYTNHIVGLLAFLPIPLPMRRATSIAEDEWPELRLDAIGFAILRIGQRGNAHELEKLINIYEGNDPKVPNRKKYRELALQAILEMLYLRDRGKVEFHSREVELLKRLSRSLAGDFNSHLAEKLLAMLSFYFGIITPAFKNYPLGPKTVVDLVEERPRDYLVSRAQDLHEEFKGKNVMLFEAHHDDAAFSIANLTKNILTKSAEHFTFVTVFTDPLGVTDEYARAYARKHGIAPSSLDPVKRLVREDEGSRVARALGVTDYISLCREMIQGSPAPKKIRYDHEGKRLTYMTEFDLPDDEVEKAIEKSMRERNPHSVILGIPKTSYHQHHRDVSRIILRVTYRMNMERAALGQEPIEIYFYPHVEGTDEIAAHELEYNMLYFFPRSGVEEKETVVDLYDSQNKRTSSYWEKYHRLDRQRADRASEYDVLRYGNAEGLLKVKMVDHGDRFLRHLEARERRQAAKLLEQAFLELIEEDNPDMLSILFMAMASVQAESNKERILTGVLRDLSRKYAIWTDNLYAKINRARRFLTKTQNERINEIFRTTYEKVEVRQGRRWAVINAGGFGTRLWPICSPSKPKAFLKIGTSKFSLFQETIKRQVNPEDPNSIPPSQVVVVINKEVEEEARDQIKALGVDIPEENILVEPMRLNDGIATRLAAAFVERKAGESAIIRIIPADHVIPRPLELNAVLAKSEKIAKLTCVYVECGVTPSKDENGELRVNDQLGHIVISGETLIPGAYNAIERIEKEPDVDYKRLTRQIGAKWNSGYGVVTIGTLKRIMKSTSPAIERIFEDSSDMFDARERNTLISKLYRTIEEVTEGVGAGLDVIVSVPATRMREATFDTICVSGISSDNFYDAGTLDAMREIKGIKHTENYVVTENGEAVSFDYSCFGNTVYGPEAGDDTKISLHGLQDMLVAYSRENNSILIVPRKDAKRAGDIPKLAMAKESPFSKFVPQITGVNVPDRYPLEVEEIEQKGDSIGRAHIALDTSDTRIITDKGTVATINVHNYKIEWRGDQIDIYNQRHSFMNLLLPNSGVSTKKPIWNPFKHAFKAISGWSLLGLGGGIDWILLFGSAFIGSFVYIALNLSGMIPVSEVVFITIGIVNILSFIFTITSWQRVSDVIRAVRLVHPGYTWWQAARTDIGKDLPAQQALKGFSREVYERVMAHEDFRFHVPGLLAFLPIGGTITSAFVRMYEAMISILRRPPPRNIMYMLPEEIMKGIPKDVHDHSIRAAKYSMRIARELGLSDRDMSLLEHAIWAHDIGQSERYKHPDILRKFDQGMLGLPKEDRAEPVAQYLIKWLDQTAPRYRIPSEKIDDARRKAVEENDYYGIWDLYIKYLVLNKQELTEAEEIIARNMYNHAERSIDKLKARNIVFSESIELVIRYHHDYYQLARHLESMVSQNRMTQKDAERIKLLESILIVVDCMEFGNNYRRRFMRKGQQRVENFHETVDVWTQRRFDEMENIDEKRPLEALKTLLGKMDTELLDIIAEGRQTKTLTPEDLTFVLRRPEFGMEDTGVIVFKMGLPEELKQRVISRLKPSGNFDIYRFTRTDNPVGMDTIVRLWGDGMIRSLNDIDETGGLDTQAAREALSRKDGAAFKRWFDDVYAHMNDYSPELKKLVRALRYSLECIDRGAEVVLLKARVSRDQLVAQYGGEEGLHLLKSKLGSDVDYKTIPFQNFLKYVIVGATDLEDAHPDSLRGGVIKPALEPSGELSEFVQLAQDYDVSDKQSVIANGIHCVDSQSLNDEKEAYISIGVNETPAAGLGHIPSQDGSSTPQPGKSTFIISVIGIGVLLSIIVGIARAMTDQNVPLSAVSIAFIGIVGMSFADQGDLPFFRKKHVILKTDGTVSDTGDREQNELLDKALNIIKERKFITGEQFQLLGGNVEFEIVENAEYLVDAADRTGRSDWVIRVNRFFFDNYASRKEIFELKLAYKLARELDYILLTELMKERHVNTSLAEISTICLLKSTSRLNDNRDDGDKVLEFYDFVEGLSKNEATKAQVEKFISFEMGFRDLMLRVYDQQFYSINFVGEPKWLDLIIKFFEDNKEYYGVKWYHRAVSFVIPQFYKGLTELDKKHILQHLRWYENYADYGWLKAKLSGGGHKYASTLHLSNGDEVPVYYNDSHEDYSAFELKEYLETKVEEEDITFLDATLKSLYPQAGIDEKDIREVYVRYLGSGAYKDAFYYLIVTAKGCFEFVTWLPHKEVDDEGHEYIRPTLLAPNELRLLEWANVQYSNRSPRIGCILSRNENVTQMSVSYLGKELTGILGRHNNKLTAKAKEEFIRSAVACYVGSAFRMGGFLCVDDPKPANLASLDMKIGIVDFGYTHNGDKLTYLGGLLKYFYHYHGMGDWNSEYDACAFDKRKIFDAFIDTFTNYVGPKKVDLPYRTAIGIDMLRQIYEDPYNILVDQDGQELEVKKALGQYLREVNAIYRPSFLLSASSLTEDFNWDHVEDRFYSIDSSSVIVNFREERTGDKQERNHYWYIAREAGIKEDAVTVSDLSPEDRIKLLDYISMDHLAVPSDEYLIILQKLSEILIVRSRAPDRVEMYRAWIRTLKKQAVLAKENKRFSPCYVEMDSDLDNDFLLGLSKTQVRDILERIVSKPRPYKRPLSNVHVDLRKEEVVLLRAVKWAERGEDEDLIGLIHKARDRFLELGRAASDISIKVDDEKIEHELNLREGVPREKIKAKLLVEQAIAANITLLNIYDEALVEDVINYAEEKGYLLSVYRVPHEGEPRTIKEVFAYQPIIGDVLGDIEKAMPGIMSRITTRASASYKDTDEAESSFNAMASDVDNELQNAVRVSYFDSPVVTTLDMPSNFARDIPAGTVIGVYKPHSPKIYKNLLCSAYILYGPITTMMVDFNNVKTGQKELAEFVWDTTEGRFLLRKRFFTANGSIRYKYTERFRGKEGEVKQQDIYTPVGNRAELPAWLNEYIVNNLEARGHKLRYTESVVTNLNEILHSGGIVIQEVWFHEAVILAKLVDPLRKQAFIERLKDTEGIDALRVRLYIGDEGQIERLIKEAKAHDAEVLEIDTVNERIIGMSEEEEDVDIRKSESTWRQKAVSMYRDAQWHGVSEDDKLEAPRVSMDTHLEKIAPEVFDGNAREDVPKIVNAICSNINKLVAAFPGRAGKTDRKNVSGDIQAGLDVYADNFLAGVIMGAKVRAMTSEELADKTSIDDFDPASDEVQIGLIKRGKVSVRNGFLVNILGDEYLVTLDPLDGSSKIDSNGTVGTIVNVYAYGGNGTKESLMELDAKKRLTSFFILYGPYTTVMYTLGEKGGVHEAVMADDGIFYVTNEDMKLPSVSNKSTVAIGATRNTWFGSGMPYTGEEDEYKQGFVDLVDTLERKNGMKSSYSGALVGDIYALVKNGGIFAYPGAKGKGFGGKLRMWFELHSVANIVQKAGGETLTYTVHDGIVGIDDVRTSDLNHTLPFYAGNKELIARVKRSLIIDLGHYVGEDSLAILVNTYNNPKATEEEKELIVRALVNMRREAGTEDLRIRIKHELDKMKKTLPVLSKKILMGIPARSAAEKVRRVKSAIEKCKDNVEIVYLSGQNEKQNLDELQRIAQDKNIEFAARIDLHNIKLKDIERIMGGFIEQVDRDRFSLLYADLAGMDKESVAVKTVQELKCVLSVVVGDFLKLKAEDIDSKLLDGEYWQLRGLTSDNTVLGMQGLFSEMVDMKRYSAAVVSNVMLESDPSVVAKIKAKRLQSGMNKVKDVLAVFNPNVTEKNVGQYLRDIGAENVFDKVILYGELEAEEGKLDENNIVKVVKEVVSKKLNLTRDNILLVGGPEYFEKIAQLVLAILRGDVDTYLDELVKFLKSYGYAYEETLIGLSTKDKAMLAKLREKRTIREESDSYKDYIEDYREYIKQIITKL